jgi:hypothetical protein
MKLIMIDDKTFNRLFTRYDNISYATRIIINTFLDKIADEEKCNYCSGACEKELTGFCKYDFSYLDTKKEKLPF